MTAFTQPRRLNHVVYVTRDTEATIRFYRDALGMRLISSAQADTVGSTQEPQSFLHTFFEMADGSCIAFFEIEGLPEEKGASVLPRWAAHLALSVDSDEELQAAREHLISQGIDVLGPVDHEGIWTSIYFFDPNGVRLELTFQNRSLTDADAVSAHDDVEAWLHQHPGAST